MTSSSSQTKSFLSRIVKSLRLGFKRSCGRIASLLGPKSYPIFAIPSGISEAKVEKELIPIESIDLPLPKTIENVLHSQFSNRSGSLPSLGLFQLSNGIATSLGGNLDQRGRLIKTYLRPVDGKSPENHDLFNFSKKRFFPKIAEAERVISLTSGWQDMFYHWMYEVLPRLALVQDLEGKIFIDQGKSFQRESLHFFGVDPTRIIDASKFQGVRAREVIVPAFPLMPNRWACRFLKSHISVETTEKRRLYLSRKDADKRRVLNEIELLPILQKYGFEIATTSQLPFAEQVKLFASAEIVVAPHGAGLSHLAFCKKGTPILEMFAPSYTHSCYWQVAAASELSYHYLFGIDDGATGDTDFEVDPKRFEKALLHALADRQH